jgi:hypothetical protein
MNQFKKMIPFALVALVYIVFSKMDGFQKEIQKFLKLKGMSNLLVQSVAFVVAVKLVKDLYSGVTGEPILEGQDEVAEEDVTEDEIETIKSNIKDSVNVDSIVEDVLSELDDADEVMKERIKNAISNRMNGAVEQITQLATQM